MPLSIERTAHEQSFMRALPNNSLPKEATMTISATAVGRALTHIGLNEDAQRRVNGSFVMLKLDPLLADGQAALEEDLSYFVENCDLFGMGLLSLDEVSRSATALNERLDAMSAAYRKLYFFDRAERVQEARKAIANAMRWS
jgi:hypothetical protein